MPTSTIDNISLVVTLDGQDYSCQFTDVSLTLPGRSAGSLVEVACPDGVVYEPGSTSLGSASGNLYVDTTDAGITIALETAYLTGATIAYEMTFYADQAATVARTYSGDAIVNSFQLDFMKPGKAKQPLDLSLVTAVPSRPAA